VNVLVESEALHERVRRFARKACPGETFDELALAIARFQARASPGFARLIARRGSELGSVSEIPAVPVEAFRLTRVAVHPDALDCVRFETSGTTSAARGMHAMRTTRTYRELSLCFGRSALMLAPRATVVALAPMPELPAKSSLGFMMLAMMEDFDGRDLQTGSANGFDARVPERWLLDEAGVQISGIRAAARVADGRGEPLLVLATSLALAALVERLGSERLDMPGETVVMQTGGFKGRSLQIEPRALRRAVAHAFGIAEARVVGEYGMTELTSQLYEREVMAPGVYFAPPWLRVEAVDPQTLEGVPAGEQGLARFVDLGNVDSAVAIVTQDLVRIRDNGVKLCGRLPAAPARGCSLAIEDLILQPRARDE
jgi:hypothetical protein